MNASGATPRSTTAALTLTRAELYTRVWATPMQRLAAEFGVSDVAIAKLCHRRNVPRPPPGYWARRWDTFALLERYVAACENRWASDASGLTPARDAWLAWAKGTVQALSPFANHPADEDRRNGVIPSSSELVVTTATAFRRLSC